MNYTSNAIKVVSKRKGGIVFPIDELVNPTIDAVLNRVPLIYDPLTKQLLLQNESDSLRVVNSSNTCNGFEKNLESTNGYSSDRCTKFDTDDEIAESKSKSKLGDEKIVEDIAEVEIVSEETNDVPDSTATSEQASSTSSACDENEECSSPSSSVYKPKKSSAFLSPSLLSSSLYNVFNRLLKKNCANDLTIVSSTQALILENRPSHLPAKSAVEEVKHKNEYEEMVKEAKRKEAKDAKVMKKLISKRKKEEDKVIEMIKVWQKEVLPNWSQAKSTKKVQDIWWSGIPSSIREKVWQYAIGNDLNLTHELFDICVSRSKEKVWTCDTANGESIPDLIKLDVSRTFPQLGLFQENGPYHETLSQLLAAYVCYRPDMSYVQGMSFLAAMLLLNMDASDAFICLANLLNTRVLISFYRVDQKMMNAYFATYQALFKENLPTLFEHFNEQQLTPDLYLMDWIYSLFSRSLPLDVASHVWDLILRDGEEFIFRVSMAILDMYKHILLNFDFINLAQYLTKLPDEIDSSRLFQSIAAIQMSSKCEKQSFNQLLETFLTKLNAS